MPHWPDEAKLHFIGGHSPTAVSHPSLKFLPALLSSLEKGLRDTIFTESFINIEFCNTQILITFYNINVLLRKTISQNSMYSYQP